MRKKTSQVTEFIESLHKYITEDPQFRKNTLTKSELQIQTEIRPLIISFLEKYFGERGYKDATAKANKSFCWEGQEDIYGNQRKTMFGSRNYPDFIITNPYLIAIEYKQSSNGSTVKQGIGQSIMHTLCEDFHYVYYLFHDDSKDKKIKNSIGNSTESMVLNKMKEEFNVFIYFAH